MSEASTVCHRRGAWETGAAGVRAECGCVGVGGSRRRPSKTRCMYIDRTGPLAEGGAVRVSFRSPPEPLRTSRLPRPEPLMRPSMRPPMSLSLRLSVRSVRAWAGRRLPRRVAAPSSDSACCVRLRAERMARESPASPCWQGRRLNGMALSRAMRRWRSDAIEPSPRGVKDAAGDDVATVSPKPPTVGLLRSVFQCSRAAEACRGVSRGRSVECGVPSVAGSTA